MSMCPECFTTGSKANCRLSKCPYRRALDAALDCFTAESQPDPLEEMAARTHPGKRLVATGNRERLTAIDGGWFGRQMDDIENTQAAFLQGTGRL